MNMLFKNVCEMQEVFRIQQNEGTIMYDKLQKWEKRKKS